MPGASGRRTCTVSTRVPPSGPVRVSAKRLGEETSFSRRLMPADAPRSRRSSSGSVTAPDSTCPAGSIGVRLACQPSTGVLP